MDYNVKLLCHLVLTGIEESKDGYSFDFETLEQARELAENILLEE